MVQNVQTTVMQQPKIQPREVTIGKNKYNVSHDANFRKIVHDGPNVTDSHTTITRFQEEGNEPKIIMNTATYLYSYGNLVSREYTSLNELKGIAVSRVYDSRFGTLDTNISDAKTLEPLSSTSEPLKYGNK